MRKSAPRATRVFAGKAWHGDGWEIDGPNSGRSRWTAGLALGLPVQTFDILTNRRRPETRVTARNRTAAIRCDEPQE